MHDCVCVCVCVCACVCVCVRACMRACVCCIFLCMYTYMCVSVYYTGTFSNTYTSIQCTCIHTYMLIYTFKPNVQAHLRMYVCLSSIRYHCIQHNVYCCSVLCIICTCTLCAHTVHQVLTWMSDWTGMRFWPALRVSPRLNPRCRSWTEVTRFVHVCMRNQ